MESGGFAGINMFAVRHVWTFSDPNVVYDSLAGVQPPFVAFLESLGEAGRKRFRSAIIDTVRQRAGGRALRTRGRSTHCRGGKVAEAHLMICLSDMSGLPRIVMTNWRRGAGVTEV